MPDGESIIYSQNDEIFLQSFDQDDSMQTGYNWLKNYLINNLNVSEGDRQTVSITGKK